MPRTGEKLRGPPGHLVVVGAEVFQVPVARADRAGGWPRMFSCAGGNGLILRVSASAFAGMGRGRRHGRCGVLDLVTDVKPVL